MFYILQKYLPREKENDCITNFTNTKLKFLTKPTSLRTTTSASLPRKMSSPLSYKNSGSKMLDSTLDHTARILTKRGNSVELQRSNKAEKEPSMTCRICKKRRRRIERNTETRLNFSQVLSSPPKQEQFFKLQKGDLQYYVCRAENEKKCKDIPSVISAKTERRFMQNRVQLKKMSNAVISFKRKHKIKRKFNFSQNFVEKYNRDQDGITFGVCLVNLRTKKYVDDLKVEGKSVQEFCALSVKKCVAIFREVGRQLSDLGSSVQQCLFLGIFYRKSYQFFIWIGTPIKHEQRGSVKNLIIDHLEKLKSSHGLVVFCPGQRVNVVDWMGNYSFFSL